MPPATLTKRTVLASLNCDGRLGVALVAALILLWTLAAGGDSLTQALRYDRVAIDHGEWWRLATAHWVHLGLRHLILDSAGLVLLWVLYARELTPGAWLWVGVWATAAIDLGLWWGEPEIQWYLGISGLLHAGWAAGAAVLTLRRAPFGILMLAILTLKLALEQRHGVSLIDATLPVVTAAHLYGALGGVMAVSLLGVGARVSGSQRL